MTEIERLAGEVADLAAQLNHIIQELADLADLDTAAGHDETETEAEAEAG